MKFTVLMVCMGNICRSPMAERFLVHALGPASSLVTVHGAGTGAWHVGQPMEPLAAAAVRARGGDPAGFAARALVPSYVTGSDLILTATIEQAATVVGHAPDALARTFVLGEFGRLVPSVSPASLPAYAPTVDAVAARGRAIVAAVDSARAGAHAGYHDEIPDPYGRNHGYFDSVADQVRDSVTPFAALLTT